MCRLLTVNTNFNTEVKIAEIKKKYIESIIRNAQNCPSILEILLFGSALESKCTEDSDIDLAIVSEKQKSKLFRDRGYIQFQNQVFHDGNYEQDYDFIYLQADRDMEEALSSSLLYQDVKRYGKTIYRRIENA